MRLDKELAVCVRAIQGKQQELNQFKAILNE